MAASTTTATSQPKQHHHQQQLRKRMAPAVSDDGAPPRPEDGERDEDDGDGEEEEAVKGRRTWARRNQWVVFAVASGACAAFNGVFAKLTTNDLTVHLARFISTTLGLGSSEGVVEVVVRCCFFGLNLVFNGVMWTLFTKALAKGQSTTQVSIMNTSTNFMITALLGLVIFAESLPPLWWLGAAMLVAGNVIIGRKDESSGHKDTSTADGHGHGHGHGDLGGDDESDDLIGSRTTAPAEEANDGAGHPARGNDYGSIPRTGA